MKEQKYISQDENNTQLIQNIEQSNSKLDNINEYSQKISKAEMELNAEELQL